MGEMGEGLIGWGGRIEKMGLSLFISDYIADFSENFETNFFLIVRSSNKMW